MRIFFLHLLIASLILSCSPAPEESEDRTTPNPDESYPELMHQVWEAHGSISTWKNYGAMTFTLNREDSSREIHMTNLADRKSLITADSFRIGMDGEKVWVAPSINAYDGNPRFYHNLVFYFYNLPFLMADPGVRQNDIGIKELDGEEYRSIRVGFEEGTGDADDDEYILLINPETKRLEWILYTVTYFVNEKVSSYNALHYADFMEVGGLTVPGKLSGYEYANDTTGNPRYEMVFTDINFSKDPYQDKMFEKPVSGEFAGNQ